ncbi:unnamed protein product [Discula destructiva]
MVYSRSILLLTGASLLFHASTVVAAATCSATSNCPEDAPCCSQYGQCGVGAYCLGGCDPRRSFSIDSCAPAPQCVSRSMTLDSLDSVASEDEYLGDASKADWVQSDGSQVLLNSEGVVLTMPKNSAGTVLASTVYMWYGNVKAKLKTSRGAGVVSAFILLSDVKDEIDFEFIGVDLETAQTNFYFQALPDWTNSENITDLSDTYANFHEYEIQWTPDTVTWLVDGKAGRTLRKSDTWNATTNSWNYPQTPARVQLSLWPGGASTNAQGTIDWAGGAIDWNSADIQQYGYDFVVVQSVDIECYNATSAPGTNNAVSYYYTSPVGTNNTVVNGKNETILASFLATGTDMEAGASSASAGGSAATAATIPGQTSSGNGNSGSIDSGTSSDSGSGIDSGSASGTGSSSDCATDVTQFTQSCATGTPSSSGAVAKGESGMGGASAFAAIVAFVFLANL